MVSLSLLLLFANQPVTNLALSSLPLSFCASNVDLVAAAKSSNCNMAASGNQAQLAGGGNALSVWTLASKNQTKRRRFPSIPMPRKH